jgi:hypothetical protein
MNWKLPKIVWINLPQTTTYLALAVLAGMWYYNNQDWKEMLLMILSYYFGKNSTHNYQEVPGVRPTV